MTLDRTQILEQARKLTAKRMQAAEAIATAVTARVDAERQLKAALEAERKAFTDAEKNGWTKTELNQLRPTKRRTKKTTTTEQPGTEPATSTEQ